MTEKLPEVRIHGRPFRSLWAEMKAGTVVTLWLALLVSELYGFVYFFCWAIRRIFGGR